MNIEKRSPKLHTDRKIYASFIRKSDEILKSVHALAKKIRLYSDLGYSSDFRIVHVFDLIYLFMSLSLSPCMLGLVGTVLI